MGFKSKLVTLSKFSKRRKVYVLLALFVIVGFGLGEYLIMKNHDDSNKIIVAKASLPESALKGGYLRTYFGVGGQASFGSVARIPLLTVKRDKDGVPYAGFMTGPKKSDGDTQGGMLKLGESIPFYDHFILSTDKYKDLAGYQIASLNPPLNYPVAGTVTLVSFGSEDNVQTVTILVKFTPEAEKEYLESK